MSPRGHIPQDLSPRGNFSARADTRSLAFRNRRHLKWTIPAASLEDFPENFDLYLEHKFDFSQNQGNPASPTKRINSIPDLIEEHHTHATVRTTSTGGIQDTTGLASSLREDALTFNNLDPSSKLCAGQAPRISQILPKGEKK